MCSARRFTRCVSKTDRAAATRAIRLPLFSAIAACLGLLGCDALRPSNRGGAADGSLSPVLVRLRDAYSDLVDGRFVVLADFETAEQEKLLRVAAVDGGASQLEQPAVDITQSRNETGAGSVRCLLPDAAATVIFDGARSDQLSLIRDWGSYQLLLFNSRASQNATLQIDIAAGREADQHWTSRVHVGPTWQLHRVDLADVGESIDIHDVRSITLRAIESTAPLTLNLDDIVLADNARELSTAGPAAGDLGVRAAGRRTHVVSRDRFDLGFCDGLICSWTSESPDNLVVRSGLGPWPVTLAAGWHANRDAPPAYDDPRMYASFGEAAATAQKVVEATPYRVQIDGHWRFVAGAASTDDMPAFHWRYSIYSDGRVFVHLRCDSAELPWPEEFVGQAIAVRADRQFHRFTGSNSADRASPTFTLLSRPGAQRADLLWIPSNPAEAGHSLFASSSDQRCESVICGEKTAAASVQFASQLVVWPRDMEAAVDAAPLARNYQQPPKISVLTGSLARDRAGDLNGDGFNEGEGTFELVASDGILRFRHSPPAAVPDRVRFSVHNTAGAKAWVYVSGRILRETGRDADDQLLFTLPVSQSAPLDVEVNTRPERAAPQITRPPATSQPGSQPFSSQN
ncbi:MAG: hypothetical protein JNG88_01905 [Phycisphaerales bacterium]|nr:hypothetical protein [Phycisphaerales bacterium]